MKQKLILATRNSGKIREFRRILDEHGSEFIDLVGLENFPDLTDVEETENSFLGNALLKARTVCSQTNLPAIADDSGLCIDALNGDPGILSARWSGAHGNDQANIDKVLRQMSEIADDSRQAHFTCVAALALPDGRSASAEGILRGKILRQQIGANGFGYDPIFLPEGSEISLAQYDARAKDLVSHRGQSLRAMAPKMTAMLATLG